MRSHFDDPLPNSPLHLPAFFRIRCLGRIRSFSLSRSDSTVFEAFLICLHFTASGVLVPGRDDDDSDGEVMPDDRSTNLPTQNDHGRFACQRARKTLSTSVHPNPIEIAIVNSIFCK